MHLLDLLFPPRCVSCNHLGTYFCKKCLAKIDFIQYQICPVCAKPAIGGATHPRCQTGLSLDGMYALAHYQGPIKDAINLLKYKLVSDLVKDLIFIFNSHYIKILPHFDLLTPVPLHPKKLRERGFNQSTLLAKLLSQRLSFSFDDSLLKRIKHTKPQSKLKRKERLINLKDAFAVNNKENIKGKIIGLVDDVSTTRATLSECTKVLKQNGAKIVWGIVLAHG